MILREQKFFDVVARGGQVPKYVVEVHGLYPIQHGDRLMFDVPKGNHAPVRWFLVREIDHLKDGVTRVKKERGHWLDFRIQTKMRL